MLIVIVHNNNEPRKQIYSFKDQIIKTKRLGPSSILQIVDGSTVDKYFRKYF